MIVLHTIRCDRAVCQSPSSVIRLARQRSYSTRVSSTMPVYQIKFPRLRELGGYRGRPPFFSV